MFNKIEFKRIREFGEIINDTFTFLRQNFKPLLKVYFYLCGFFLLATVIATVTQQISVRGTLLSGMGYGNFSSLFLRMSMFSVQYVVLIIVSVANYTALSVSILSFISLYIRNGNVAPTVEQVWTYFKYFFFRAFGSYFIICLFVGVCFACCLIPGIYVFPAMSLFFPIMIMENSSLDKSFGRGFKLVKEYWWVTAASLFISWLIAYILVTIVSLPGTIFTMAGALVAGQTGIVMSEIVIIISAAIQVLAQVFIILPIITSTLCYFNLVERHENTGLLGRIDQFGETKEPFKGTEEY